MSHTFSVKLLNSISCSPSPCTGRYPARTTMGTPLPCRIFIGLKPNSLAAFRFRQSPFKNLTTVWRDRLSDTTFVLYYVCSCSVISSFCPCILQGEAGYHGLTFVTVFRQGLTIEPLRLSFNQYRLYPHIYRFTSPHGQNLTVSSLVALPTCYTPHRLSLNG